MRAGAVVTTWLVVSIGLAAAGCATPSSPKVYSRSDAMKSWSVSSGEVVDVKPVVIDGTQSPLGTAGGGYIGYEVGHSMGHGNGSDIAAAVGAVAGAAAGRAVERTATRQDGLQITVKLDGGDTIAIVQSADVGFSNGERVKVLRRGHGEARVTKS